MNRRIKRILASMLTVTMILSNSDLTVFAEETNVEEETIMVESDQKTTENTSNLKPSEE